MTAIENVNPSDSTFWYALLFIIISLAVISCTDSPTAEFAVENDRIGCCDGGRDIVFIVDHSGSMYDNDSSSLRWKVLKHAAENWLNMTDDNGDRFVAIPFGGKAKVRELGYNPPSGLNGSGWFDLRRQQDRTGLLQLANEWDATLLKGDHSQFTYPLSGFEKLENLLANSAEARDIFVFFISDGKVDPLGGAVAPPRDAPDVSLHRDRLRVLLEGHAERWRLYNICIGTSVDVQTHLEMLASVGDFKRANGFSSFPGSQGAERESRYLIRIESPDVDINRAKLTAAIKSVLCSASSYLPGVSLKENATSFAGLGSLNLDLTFTLEPSVDTTRFSDMLSVRFHLEGHGEIDAKVKLVEFSRTETTSSVLSYRIDQQYVAGILKDKKAAIDQISKWTVSLDERNTRTGGGARMDFKIAQLNAAYVHGWSLTSDTLSATLEHQLHQWWRDLLHLPQPCESGLHFTGYAENKCGRPINLHTGDVRIRLPNGAVYPASVKKIREGSRGDGIGDMYKLKADIQAVPFFTDLTGERVNVTVEFVEHQFIFDHAQISVPICAKTIQRPQMLP